MISESVFLIDASRLFREGLRRIFADSTFVVAHESVSVEDALPLIGLSAREMQILGCLVSGDQNKQIAYELKISDGTVKVHLKAILKKIRVQNRTQAAIWAMNHGISRNLAAKRAAAAEIASAG